MGKKSRAKKERKEMGYSGKELKNLKRKSHAVSYETTDGHMQAYNPLKTLVQGKVYKDETGFDVLNFTVQKYAAYMQANMEKNKEEEKKD